MRTGIMMLCLLLCGCGAPAAVVIPLAAGSAAAAGGIFAVYHTVRNDCISDYPPPICLVHKHQEPDGAMPLEGK